METVPKTLDWVKARAECSLEHLFSLLIEVLDSDVKSMRAHAPDGTQLSLNVLTASKVSISKVQPDRGFSKAGKVVFDRTSLGINVGSDRNDLMFTAKPSLDATGSCRLEIDGQPMELWQVSRKALEDLFFS